jgi:predicted RNase H-like HicB family nuclease
MMRFSIQLAREQDGRWIAEVPELPGVLVYGVTSDAATAKAKALALRTVADRLDHGEEAPDLTGVTFAAA